MKSFKAVGMILLIGIILVHFPTLRIFAHPFRGIRLTTPFPRIEINERQKIQFELNIINEGNVAEILDLEILGPVGWKSVIKKGNYVIKSIYINKNESRTIDFEVAPSPEAEAGTYNFVIKAISQDRILEASLNVQVDITKTVAPSDISLSTPYPSIEGPSGIDYEFRVTVWNRGSEDRVIYFTAFHPPEWIVNFKPRYEDRLVRSLDFGAEETIVLMVTVFPPPDVEPASYNITIIASSGTLTKSLSFDLNIIGTYQLELSTLDGLLSIDAIQGRDTHVTIDIYNSGTASLENIHFSSSKPKGWDVIFEPNDISVITPGSSWQIRATIKPPSDAIPGDYAVELTSIADPYKTSDTLNLRLTVRGSVAWGFVGVSIIAFLMATLFVIFWWLGRR